MSEDAYLSIRIPKVLKRKLIKDGESIDMDLSDYVRWVLNNVSKEESTVLKKING